MDGGAWEELSKMSSHDNFAHVKHHLWYYRGYLISNFIYMNFVFADKMKES